MALAGMNRLNEWTYRHIFFAFWYEHHSSFFSSPNAVTKFQGEHPHLGWRIFANIALLVICVQERWAKDIVHVHTIMRMPNQIITGSLTIRSEPDLVIEQSQRSLAALRIFTSAKEWWQYSSIN